MGLRTQRLLALAVVAALVFNFPLMLLWSSNAFAIFVWWAAVIALLAWLMERRGGGVDEGVGHERDHGGGP